MEMAKCACSPALSQNEDRLEPVVCSIAAALAATVLMGAKPRARQDGANMAAVILNGRCGLGRVGVLKK